MGETAGDTAPFRDRYLRGAAEAIGSTTNHRLAVTGAVHVCCRQPLWTSASAWATATTRTRGRTAPGFTGRGLLAPSPSAMKVSATESRRSSDLTPVCRCGTSDGELDVGTATKKAAASIYLSFHRSCNDITISACEGSVERQRASNKSWVARQRHVVGTHYAAVLAIRDRFRQRSLGSSFW